MNSRSLTTTAAVAPLGIALALLAGCALELSPTPIAIQTGLANPAAEVRPSRQTTHLDILYATNRMPTRAGKSGARYSKERSPTLRLGTARVRIGAKDLTWDQLVEQTNKSKTLPVNTEWVEEVASLPSTKLTDDIETLGRTYENAARSDPVWQAALEWAATINTQLEDSSRRHVQIYIHGATTDFNTPIKQFATFAHHMREDGVHIAYCWPVGETAFGYFRAGDIARGSIRSLRELLIFLAEETIVEKINIVAYSAGGVVATGALQQIRLQHSDVDASQLPGITKIGSVILTASDEDLPTTWQYWLDEVDLVTEQLTLYVSNLDFTMGLAWFANPGRTAVGSAAGQYATDAERRAEEAGLSRVHIVNVTSAQTSAGLGKWGHSYWKDNPWVNTDVILQWNLGLQPWERGLVRPEGKSDATWWVFPKDYPDRLGELDPPR